MNLDILAIGGGTGGHLFPAIATLEEANSRGLKTALITDDRCKKYLKNDIESYIIKLGNGEGIWGRLIQVFLTVFGIARSFWLLRKLKPKLVIGFGGYVAYPTLLAANILQIPLMLHEQNCFLGKVNKAFARKARILCLGFDETLNLPKSLDARKVIFTGNPIRKDIAAIKKPGSRHGKEFSILITGGSQGARILSEMVPDAIGIIKKRFPDKGLKITQQARPEDIEYVKNLYSYQNIIADISNFFYDMPERISNASIFIGRAGASTIAEVIDAELPSILIPYPYAVQKHQHANASFIEKRGGGVMIDQGELDPESLAAKIIPFLEDPAYLKSMKNSLKKMKKNSLNIIMILLGIINIS